jgi:hypothetical protein
MAETTADEHIAAATRAPAVIPDAAASEKTTPDKTTSDAPAGRYRRTPLSRAAKIRRGVVITLGIAALTVVATWYGLRNATPPLNATVLSYKITAQAVTVTYEIDRTSSKAAICVLEAPNLAGDDIGRRQVDIPAGPRRVVMTTTIRTSGKAITGEVEECQFAD